MNHVLRMEEIQRAVVNLRDESVILDCDVAEIYGVETKRINEAVKNNPDKFPPEYMFKITGQEFDVLRSKISTAKFSKTRTRPTAFTEKGLYMIATILKSKEAVEATFGIIETFAKIRELTRTVKALSLSPEKAHQKTLMQKSGKLIAEVLDDGLVTSDSETTIELNFAVLKFKHTVKKAADKS
jgi:hypothetical protein